MNKKALSCLFTAMLITSGFMVSCVGNGTKNENTAEYLVIEEQAAHDESKVVNYLNAKEVIQFEGVAYDLVWSNPPQMKGQYYIQEYMPKGQNIDRYTDLFILDLFKNKDTSLDAEVKEKKDWLDNRKKTEDPTLTYKISYNEELDQFFVDMMITDGDLVEWTVVRYIAYEVDGNFEGVRTLSMSKRGYEGMDAFMAKIADTKAKCLSDFLNLPFPEVNP